MAWIKRNLIFVITVAVGVLLIGYCSFLLYSAMQKNSQVLDDYTQTLNSLNEMRQKRPYPNDEAIKAAKQDQQRVQAFLGDFSKVFAPFPQPPAEDARGFKDYLQRTIYQLGLDATNDNVTLPPDYAFSWSQQKERLNYPPECIAPWMQQLEEEKIILHILFNSHINYLEYIKRVPTPCDDSGGSDYIASASAAAPWGTVTPYAIAFRGFSSDLASVLSQFAQSSNCFIVKEIDVTPSKAQLPQVFSEGGGARAGMGQPTYSYQSRMEGRPRRFGEGGQPFQPPPQQVQVVTAAPAAPAAPVTVLAENPLYITMAIDVVKLK